MQDNHQEAANSNQGHGHGHMDKGLAALHVLLQILHIPANVQNLKHEFSPDRLFDELSLMRAIKSLNLKVRAIDTDFNRFDKITFPAIGVGKDGTFFLIAKYDAANSRVLVFDVDQRKPVSLDIEQFEQMWSGRLLLVTKRHGLFDTDRPFNLSWFVPIILKFKRLYTEVLVASFFIQLFALITPMCFRIRHRVSMLFSRLKPLIICWACRWRTLLTAVSVTVLLVSESSRISVTF